MKAMMSRNGTCVVDWTPSTWFFFRLVHRLLNPLGFAVGQLAVFQGASEAPLSDHNGRASNAEKQPTGRDPEGCVENGSLFA